MSDGSGTSANGAVGDANGTAGDTDPTGDSGMDGSNEQAWRFQWPITRAPKIPAYDPALDKWLDDLAASDDSDTKLTAGAFKKQINLADYRRNQWEARYYNLRSAAIILAAALTALASASVGVTGTGDFAIKIATAVLSFFIAAITGLLELQRASSRWALYRVLRNDLFQAVWALQNSPDYATKGNEEKARILGQELSQAVNHFEQQYLLQVVVSEGASGPKPVKPA